VTRRSLIQWLAVFGGVAVLAADVSAQREADDRTRAMVHAYLDVQAALAADSLEKTKAPAALLAERAAAAGPGAEAVAKAASAVQGAKDLKDARAAFGPLSDAVIARVQAEGSRELLAEVKLAYCPMARRSWLQREDTIRNPHYGSQMLTCGEFRPLEKK
jgi:hypothetical protein